VVVVHKVIQALRVLREVMAAVVAPVLLLLVGTVAMELFPAAEAAAAAAADLVIPALVVMAPVVMFVFGLGNDDLRNS
jgi:heme/copper-type cytochrome/quinol oxidase subunit 2